MDANAQSPSHPVNAFNAFNAFTSLGHHQVFGGVLGRRARAAHRSGATERDCGRRVGLLDVHAAVR